MQCVFLTFSQSSFNGLTSGLNDLTRLSDAKTRSISPENFTGEKGKGGMATIEEGIAGWKAKELGQGWKVNPYIFVQPDSTYVIADIKGPGAIQHIWMTPAGSWRHSIIRIYYEKIVKIHFYIDIFF